MGGATLPDRRRDPGIGATPGAREPAVIDKDLLAILACPETHQPLAEADAALLARLNRAIGAGQLRNVGGQPVEAVLEAGLVRADGRICYPVRDGIPVLLIDEGLPVPA